MIDIKAKKLFFVSPHLDDAALSAGALISSLSGKKDMTLINVFTSPSTAIPSFSVKKMLASCNAKDSQSLFKTRKIEDKKAFENTKIKIMNLDYTDALWRQRESRLSKYLPEAGYVYPIFSLFAKSGKISSLDESMITKIKNDLVQIVGDSKEALVFCPLGLGNHVDHLIVRRVVEELFHNVIFWSDFPYCQTDSLSSRPSFTFTKMQAEKYEMVKKYKSQLSLLFPNGIPSNMTEAYYEK